MPTDTSPGVLRCSLILLTRSKDQALVLLISLFCFFGFLFETGYIHTTQPRLTWDLAHSDSASGVLGIQVQTTVPNFLFDFGFGDRVSYSPG